jgi:hypothetical protein
MESVMLRKSTILAIAASAVLGLTMLTPEIASARAGHGGGGGFHGGGGGIARAGGLHGGGRAFQGGHRFHGGGHAFQGRHLGGQHRRFGHDRHLHHRHHAWRHRWRWHHNRWYWEPYPYVVAPVTYGVATTVAPAAPCSCLSKEYTPEGAVLFKDNCTNEMAMNPPAVAPTAEIAPTQQPQAAYVPQYPPQVTPTSTQ